MNMTRRILFAAFLAGAALLPIAARAQTATPGPCIPGALPSGALSLICVPAAGWNGELVVFAHGYVSVNQPLPLVTLHTTADEVVPFWHELLYLPKIDLSDRGRFFPIPAFRYGHCNFTRDEVLGAFALAVRQP